MLRVPVLIAIGLVGTAWPLPSQPDGGLRAQIIQRRLPPIIKARDAVKYVGRDVIVEEEVRQIVRAPAEGVTYLDLGGTYPHQTLRIVVPTRIQGQIDGAVWYVGRVRVRGLVERGPDKALRIVCAEPGQIVPVRP
jgi:hypothetical protein